MLQLPKYKNVMLFNNIKRSFLTKSFSEMYSKTNQFTTKDIDNNQFTPIFKTSHMSFFIGLNRFKRIQATALFCLIPTCFGLNLFEYLTLEEVICASLIGFGLTTGLHVASWFVSNNLIIFVYLSKDEKKCRLSYVSYWGNREELLCDIEDIDVIKCSKLSIFSHKIQFKKNKNTLKLITRDATIFNNAKCRKVFGSDVI